MITVKLPKNPEHNPREKKTGPCPVTGLPCTDVTGEHHTIVSDVVGKTIEQVREAFESEFHVTRVELM
jgi:hypothetical protein